MGNCVPKADLAFKQNGFKKHAQEIHMTITREMTRTDEDIKVVRKFLLLGAGSCGKSTLFRQLKCIYGTGFEASDVLFANCTIRMNCVLAILKLMQKCVELSELDEETQEKCSIDLESQPHLIPMIRLVLQFQRKTFQHRPDNEASNAQLRELGRAIACLWSLPQIQETYRRRHSFSMAANMDFFLNKVTEVFNPSYCSSNEDYIKSRITTTAISDAMYVIEGQKLQMFDVGGQRSERQKWIHLFDGITSVIFVAALDHYCSVLFEDESKNALEESLDLFAELRLRDGNSLRHFFNPESYDPKNPEYYDEYLGPEYAPTGNRKKDDKLLDQVVEASTDFILEQFMRRNHYPERTFSVHKAMTAVDEDQVKNAFLDLLLTCEVQMN